MKYLKMKLKFQILMRIKKSLIYQIIKKKIKIKKKILIIVMKKKTHVTIYLKYILKRSIINIIGII